MPKLILLKKEKCGKQLWILLTRTASLFARTTLYWGCQIPLLSHCKIANYCQKVAANSLECEVHNSPANSTCHKGFSGTHIIQKSKQHFLEDLRQSSFSLMEFYFKKNIFELIITYGNHILRTQIVKHYNDYVDRQSCRRGRGIFIFLKVGDIFTNFRKNISTESSGKICRNAAILMQSRYTSLDFPNCTYIINILYIDMTVAKVFL